ncbi:redoxin family protein [Stenotrophomonas tumulicola]|uniref:Redoxin family protein n=1 Tax=Stenotrophomonas tumulicola TaxID=1685415 RepID=A0A7W3II12_9GAMM|nr:redoxin family protein [Stenotrophomonas tumulicola]MBA8681771.1 redoxin family protein [Stenotrophomonas tumulicola]
MGRLRSCMLPLLLALASVAVLLAAWASTEAGEHVAVAAPAAGFDGGGSWFNSPPLAMPQLRGKVVLVEFWAYGCINCLRVAPYVQRWHEQHAAGGLVVVGVHTPEFAHEGLASNVQDAVTRLGITYPVVQDNQYRIWNAWGNRFWPALYLIDRKGQVVYRHYGEGGYARTGSEIMRLLAES